MGKAINIKYGIINFKNVIIETADDDRGCYDPV